MNETALIQVDPPKILAMHKKPTRAKSGEVVGVVPGTAVVPVVTLERPDVDRRLHSISRLDPVAHADRVEIGWAKEQRSNEQIVDAIKAKAQEVIESRFPATKQRNMLAETLLASVEGRDATTHRASYAWIEAVRRVSNELESALIEKGELPDFASLEVPYGD